MSEYLASSPDGWSYTGDPSASAVNAGPRSGQKNAFPGQAGNTVALNTADQAIGIVACPAITAGAQTTFTWTNALINTHSIITFRGARQGTTTPAAGAHGLYDFHEAPGSGSVVVHVYNPGAANLLSTDLQFELEVLATSAG